MRQRFVNLRLCHQHRRRNPQRVSVEPSFADQEVTLTQHFNNLIYTLYQQLFNLTIFNQLNPLHQSHTTYITNNHILIL